MSLLVKLKLHISVFHFNSGNVVADAKKKNTKYNVRA